MENYILKGNIYYSVTPTEMEMLENQYLICKDGKSAGVFKSIPKEYEGFVLYDYSNHTIIPGLIDLHVHAPQYGFRSTGMDMELLDWLLANAFKEEGKFKDLEYAKKAYGYYVGDLVKSATTRACIFASRHTDATILFMEELEKTGLITYVGKVNMDRNAPDYLVEESAEESISETIRWIESVKYLQNTKPMITPRFIPSCTDELMYALGDIQKKYNLTAQSHLSENFGEIEWVKELCPNSKFYGDAYNEFGLFGTNGKTIMAHCVHSSDEELEMMKENGVFIAHCPESNINVSSGIAPARKYMEKGMEMGLGSDVSGGTDISMFKAMVHAIQVSKLRWRLIDDTEKALTTEEVFYLATIGGGKFFGDVGSFAEGYEFDAVVIDDEQIPHPQELTLMQRLERILYLSDDRHIVDKFVAGQRIQ